MCLPFQFTILHIFTLNEMRTMQPIQETFNTWIHFQNCSYGNHWNAAEFTTLFEIHFFCFFYSHKKRRSINFDQFEIRWEIFYGFKKSSFFFHRKCFDFRKNKGKKNMLLVKPMLWQPFVTSSESVFSTGIWSPQRLSQFLKFVYMELR